MSKATAERIYGFYAFTRVPVCPISGFEGPSLINCHHIGKCPFFLFYSGKLFDPMLTLIFFMRVPSSPVLSSSGNTTCESVPPIYVLRPIFTTSTFSDFHNFALSRSRARANAHSGCQCLTFQRIFRLVFDIGSTRFSPSCGC